MRWIAPGAAGNGQEIDQHVGGRRAGAGGQRQQQQREQEKAARQRWEGTGAVGHRRRRGKSANSILPG
jgi:hypothetical protein